jgi:outer membrane biosynthesis protein TonB
VTTTAWTARRRGLVAAALLALASGWLGCVSFGPPSRPTRQELLESFDQGNVRLECARCRYDFRSSEWMLEQGQYEALVVSILESGDGSGRSWYLLGRAAEAQGRRELALYYYQKSLATSRNPITALWPLYEDVRYRVRRLAANAPAEPEAERVPLPAAIERVNVDSLVVATRPGPVGAFVVKLRRGDPVAVLDRSGDWEQVRLADDRVGWVWGDYTSAPASEAKPAEKPEAEAGTEPEAKVEAKKKRPAPKKAAARSAKTAKRVLAKRRPSSAPAAAKAPTAATADARPAASPRQLDRSSAAGILGAPLPQGASLAGRSHGASGTGDHPTETYAIEAQPSEILGFFEREMESAGWRKVFVSSEYLLYFEKDERTVGVLVDRQGGLFTLMGS